MMQEKVFQKKLCYGSLKYSRQRSKVNVLIFDIPAGTVQVASKYTLFGLIDFDIFE